MKEQIRRLDKGEKDTEASDLQISFPCSLTCIGMKISFSVLFIHRANDSRIQRELRVEAPSFTISLTKAQLLLILYIFQTWTSKQITVAPEGLLDDVFHPTGTKFFVGQRVLISCSAYRAASTCLSIDNVTEIPSIFCTPQIKEALLKIECSFL